MELSVILDTIKNATAIIGLFVVCICCVYLQFGKNDELMQKCLGWITSCILGMAMMFVAVRFGFW